MIEKFAKLEEMLNKVLGKIFTAIFVLISKMIPSPISNFYHRSKLGVLTWRKSKVDTCKTYLLKVHTFTKNKSDQFFAKVDDIQKYPVKEKGIETIQKAKNFLLTTTPKQYKEIIVSFFKPKIKLLKLKIKSVNKPNAIIATSLVALVIFGSFGVYFGANEIFRTEYPSRKIASVQEYDYRPEYKLYEQKTLKILNMKVPVIVDGVEKINSITIDFSLRTSTRFAKYYLIQYEYKLKDYFFTTVEPVISDFPIEEEGKEVLKEKIQEEINNFLYENHVEGEVEEVNILYMVGS